MPLVYLTEKEIRYYIRYWKDKVKITKCSPFYDDHEERRKDKEYCEKKLEKLLACLQGEEGFSKKEFEFLLGRPNKVSQEGAEKCTEKLKRYLGE